MRLELYVQLMKQLIHAEKQLLQKLWSLLFASLMHWPPPATIENFLAAFVRSNLGKTSFSIEKVNSAGVTPHKR